MFPAEHARHHDRSVVSRDWHPAAFKAAGLRRTIRLHDLRRSAAGARLAGGRPMMYVQRQLGHAEVGTTIRVYGHLEESLLLDAAERAEVAMFGHADPAQLVPTLFPPAATRAGGTR
jgi:integrase